VRRPARWGDGRRALAGAGAGASAPLVADGDPRADRAGARHGLRPDTYARPDSGAYVRTATLVAPDQRLHRGTGKPHEDTFDSPDVAPECIGLGRTRAIAALSRRGRGGAAGAGRAGRGLPVGRRRRRSSGRASGARAHSGEGEGAATPEGGPAAGPPIKMPRKAWAR